jgi:methylated-DNA-[protein]-cysteine S-methyltransferase
LPPGFIRLWQILTHPIIIEHKEILMDRLIYSLFPTELGWIGILGSECGLRRLVLPQPSAKDALHLLVDDPKSALCNDLQYLQVWYRIRDYFAGKQVDFSSEVVDLPGATHFQEKVWQAVRRIPYGETRTYRQIAEEVGSAESYRAVGQAVGANPVPIIIPCHRVVGMGELGGYAGGPEMKKKLLAIEAAGRTAAS